MDDLDLLRDGDGDGGAPKGRPWGLLAVALAAVLVAVSGLVWVVGSLTDGNTDVVPAATSPSATAPAPSTPGPSTPALSTPAPTTPAAAPTTTEAPLTIAPAPSTTAGSAPPLPTLRPTTPRPAPTTTRATPTKRPTLPPLPPPTGLVVPDVTGLRVPTATIVLRSAGFKVAVPGGVIAPRPDQRRVRAQTPPAGTRAPKGATVTLLLDSS